MADIYAAQKRSDVMRRVRSRDSKAELVVRRVIHGMGYRYRLHRKDLPGHPDLAFIAMRKAIFVHGCFWHGHTCRAGKNRPKSNTEYWQRKLERNMDRDVEDQSKLVEMGWRVLIVWECELRDKARLRKRVVDFLED